MRRRRGRGSLTRMRRGLLVFAALVVGICWAREAAVAVAVAAFAEKYVAVVSSVLMG